jgi:hypothetical protein
MTSPVAEMIAGAFEVATARAEIRSGSHACVLGLFVRMVLTMGWPGE